MDLDKVLSTAIKDGDISEEVLKTIPADVRILIRNKLLSDLITKAKDDFHVYVRLIAPVLLPEHFVDGRHIRVMSERFMELERSIVESQKSGGKIPAQRLQLFLPPGGMKSKLTKMFITWCLGRHPMWNILQLGHSTKFAIDNFGREVKTVLQSEEFKAIFPDDGCRMRVDARSSQSFELKAGGRYFCAGAGSKIAGRRAHLLVCDDVVSEQEAYSPAERNKINEWYIPGARSRVLAYGGELIVNTRWHLDDLSGYMEKIDEVSDNPWKIVKFPAILDYEGSKMLGLPEGGSFWPELWPERIFHDAKKTMSPSKFNALYMQNPVPDDGAIIKDQDFQRWHSNEPPMCEYIVASLDTAFSQEERADYSAYSIWGIFYTKDVAYNGKEIINANMILLGADKGRWTFGELCEKMEEIKIQFNPDLYIIEKKASGQSLIQEFRLRQFPLFDYQPDKSKLARLHACENPFKSGRIWVPANRDYVTDLLNEVIQYPGAPHDDYVDTTTQAVLWMRKNMYIPSPEEVGFDSMQDEDDSVYKKSTTSYWSNV